MAIYNLIYTSPEKETWLWNGKSFDLLKNENNKNLFFSGSGVEDAKLISAMKRARETAREQFPGDKNQKIDKIEITVNDKDTEGGHKGRTTS